MADDKKFTRDASTISGKPTFDRTKVDPEKRTIEVAFSSEEPVERWGENEVLSHEKGDADFSRLNDSHPLLLGHNEYDPKSQIGVIENARIDSDKVGRAVVRFSKSALAQEIFQDVQDGIRKLVSVGYERTGVVSSKKASDNMVTTRYRWMPTHIAIVPVPADTKVGVGRAKDQAVDSNTKEEPKNEQTRKFMTAEEQAAKDANEKATRTAIEAGINKDRERRSKIHATAKTLGEQYKNSPDAAKVFRDLAEKADTEGTSIEDFNAQLLAAMPNVRKLETSSANIGMTDKDVRSYSLMRAIRSCIDNGGKISNDCPEYDYHQQADKAYGKRAAGFWVPADVAVGSTESHKMQRDMQAGVFGSGGAFVPTLLATTPIELLRNKMVLRDCGIQVLGGLSGNVAIPRQTGAATAYSVTEIGALTLSTQTIDQIALTPRRVGATNNYSKQLLIQSSIDVENFIRSDMMEVVAIKWDYLGLNGAGANSEPLGVVNTPGIGSVTFGAAATYAKLVSFETALNAANARNGKRSYITSPTAKGVLKSAAKLLTGATTVAATALWENDEINGYSAYDTNQVLNNQMLFGNWNDLILGLFGGFDVIVDPYTLAKNAEVAVTVNTFGDYAVRHAQSFAASADSAAQ